MKLEIEQIGVLEEMTVLECKNILSLVEANFQCIRTARHGQIFDPHTESIAVVIRFGVCVVPPT